MTEISLPWDGTNIGDALLLAPYTADQWTLMYRDIFSMLGNYGVFMRTVWSLECALFGGNDSPCVVNPGVALVAGQYYQNSVVLPIVIPRPGALTRFDRIVLRRTWATKQTRATRLAGVEGGGAPIGMTQIFGTTYDIPLCTIEVPLAGAMILTDNRIYRNTMELEWRQGGHAVNWNTQGTTNYRAAIARVQGGTAEDAGVGGVIVTFPVAFVGIPLVFVTSLVVGAIPFVFGTAIGTTTIKFLDAVTDAPCAGIANWLAVGPD